MEILNIGLGEVLLILVIALLVFGPEELPRVARRMGRAVGQMRDATSEMQRLIMQESEPVRRSLDETRREFEDAARPLKETHDVLQANNPATLLQKEYDYTVEAVKSSYKPRSRVEPAPLPTDAQDGVPDPASQAEREPSPEEAAPEVTVRPPRVPPIARGEIADEFDDA